MGMRETFQIIIDVATENSQKSLKGLRSEVSKTEGGFNKFKVGVSGGMDFVKDHAASFALGAGTALVGFGIKAVAAFEETAKAALDLSSATGLAVEDASRWIAVGDDFQISAETLQSSIGKIGKSLDADKWSKYGIATRDAGGQARDANDILTESLGMLSNIKNGTERARVGNELFGKGYAGLSPMIGHTTDEYKKMLGTVEKGQVITKAEAERAEKMRLAQDKLSDALKDVTLAAGQAVTELAPAISSVADFVTEINNLGSKLGGSGGGGLFSTIIDGIKTSPLEQTFHIAANWGKSAWGYISGSTDKAERDAAAADSAAKAVEHLGTTSRAFAVAKGPVDDYRNANEKLKPAIDHVTTSLQDEIDAANRLRLTEMAAIDIKYAYALAILDGKDAISKFDAVMKDNKSTTEDAERAYIVAEKAIADTARAYATSKGDVDGSTQSINDQIASLYIQASTLAPNSPLMVGLREQLALLQGIAAANAAGSIYYGQVAQGRKANAMPGDFPTPLGGVSFPPPPPPKLAHAHGATGGIVTRPTNALIGEAGPEMVIPLSSMPGASPLPSGIGGGASINLTVNAGLGTDGAAVGQQIVNMLKQYQRTNGPFDFTSR